ncbi:M48 family metallopeptidase [Boseongicola aestuarii]|uniref:Peptidase family M48 n=1 Tax=Boseongicola aestuarii TaxID=1470561 RepID=A0A238J1X1_9RHOB|nr:M48 family metallopeptidase [Boseongicola aestuarii]SMX24617.1 Peptidase family M48 [Boseongicola aestuarii]
MRSVCISLVAILGLAACDIQVEGPSGVSRPTEAPVSQSRTGGPQSLADFRAVVRQVEPVAERTCRELRPRANCDFRIFIDDREGLPPNAYQTLDENGRPLIGFTPALFAEMRNRDELAFALSHEAAHHIEGHIPQIQNSAAAGAILGTLIGSLAGLDQAGVETAQNIGGTIGARRYSKGFELEADSLGARIAQRSGYDPLRGVLYFARSADPGDRFLRTHPPNADRINTVRRAIGG